MKQPKNLSQRIGALVQMEESEHGWRLIAEDAVLEIAFWRETMVRVRAQKRDRAFDEISYAVVAEPEAVSALPAETQNLITFATDKLRLEVDKSALGLKFFDREGRLLNADDPAFGISWMGTEVTNYKVLQDGERFIGMGEKNGGLDRRGSAYVHWNTDAFAYDGETDPLYTTTPFYIGVQEDRMYGIFLDNSYRSTFNFGASNERFASFSADDGDLNYYFIAGDTVAEIVSGYTWLTGRMELPPLWSLGYQQCRYSYYPDHKVLNVARSFREKSIPADVIYLDIHYMDAFKIFTWHPEHFPEPKKMISELREMGFHVVIIVDPGIKREEGYSAYESGQQEGQFVTYPDGTTFHGQVWPGWSAFPDFTRAEAREWWGKQFSIYVDAGVEGFWNDMNEPTAWGHSIPDLIEFHYEGDRATLKQARNVYGMQMSRATAEGVKQLMGGQRPFVLTRAAYSGIQRYSAVWTGDNVATDEHMLVGVRLVNSLGLAGVAFSGYDLSGFLGDCTPELFSRWVAIAAFSPFFRGHSMVNSRDSEPWSFGEVTETIARNYIALRYRLLPYIYSAFYEATQTGMPVARSLAFNTPFDPKIYAYPNEYRFGASILVAAVDSKHHLHKIYLPEGEWYDLLTDEYYPGGQELVVEANLEKLPLFVAAGAVLPMQSLVQHTDESPDATLELHVYAGGPVTEYIHYEDDGQTEAHLGGNYHRREIRHDPRARQIAFAPAAGEYPSHFSQVKVCWHGLNAAPTVSVNGASVGLGSAEDIKFIEPIPKFDPLGAPMGPPLIISVYTLTVPLVSRGLLFQY
ncbi:MAG: TIM-barrel domain-containing protein [Bacteroidota bacterium]